MPEARLGASENAGVTPMGAEIAPELRAWLSSFERSRGRPLRALHLGNIANNAYLNARFLRGAGVEVDVLSQSYHIISSPEWEDADFHDDPGDDFAPRWHAIDLGDFVRPHWFAQGPLPLAAAYLDAMRSGRMREAAARWRSLGLAQRIHSHPRVWEAVRGARLAMVTAVALARLARRKFLAPRDAGEPDAGAGSSTTGAATELCTRFGKRFPSRLDPLTPADVHDWLGQVPLWRSLFRHYDVVQGYATEAIYPLVTGGVPYVAYEHGTLRVFTMGDDPLHRLTSLAYREADHVFITNGDCLDYARRLGVECCSPMIHPVDVAMHESVSEAEVAEVRRRYGADVLLLCPLRHDWAVKGTDVHLRALPELRRRLGPGLRLVLCRWGEQVSASEALLAELGCADAVTWVRPLPRRELVRHMKAADLVLDQMALPHFGATAPQALAAGAQVVMSYRPESTEWIIPEPAPILQAFEPAQVVEVAMRALEPGRRQEAARRAREWIHLHHHPRRIVEEHVAAYRRLVGDEQCRGHREPRAARSGAAPPGTCG